MWEINERQFKETHVTEGWDEPTRMLLPWSQGFGHPTRNECMGWFTQIYNQISTRLNFLLKASFRLLVTFTSQL